MRIRLENRVAICLLSSLVGATLVSVGCNNSPMKKGDDAVASAEVDAESNNAAPKEPEPKLEQDEQAVTTLSDAGFALTKND